MDTEVLIVGGGPAGSHLAWHLARAGRDCLLIDRARFPRDKVCGGGVSAKAARLLGGLPEGLVRHTVTGALITHRNRFHVAVDLPRPAGFTVTRRELDHWLWRRAGAAGAVLQEGVSYLGHHRRDGLMVVRTTLGEVRCRLLVGADGAGSRVRRALVGRGGRRCAPGLEVLLPVPAPAALAGRALFDLGAVPGGYGWVFPKGDHLNVGVFAGVGAGVRRQHLETFLARYGLAGEMVRLGYPIPLEGPEVVEGPGVWLLGDAAGLAEPMLGEGIYHALLSAEVAAGLLRQPEWPAPGRYRQALRRALAREWQAARLLARWLFPRAATAVRHWARRPRFSRRFAALMTGECGFGRCLWASLLELPWLCLAPPRLPLGGPVRFHTR